MKRPAQAFSSLCSALQKNFLEKHQLGLRLPLKTVGPALSTCYKEVISNSPRSRVSAEPAVQTSCAYCTRTRCRCQAQRLCALGMRDPIVAFFSTLSCPRASAPSPCSPLEGTQSTEDISKVPDVCGRRREGCVRWVEGGSGQVADFRFIARIPKAQVACFKNIQVLLKDSSNSDFFSLWIFFL